MTDTSWEDRLWTDATRAEYLQAGETAIEALRAHLTLVAGTSSEADEPAIDESAETVRQAFIAVSDAQFEYSATVGPFSLLEDEDDDGEEDEDDELGVDVDVEHANISILLRRDFRLTSEAALIEAGTAAYREAFPDEPLDAAIDDVQELGRALYQIVHARGVDALADVEGLEPVVGIILAVGRDELLTEADLDELQDDPGELFSGEVDVIYSQAEVWS